MKDEVVVEEKSRAIGCRRQINRFSAALLIMLVAIVAVDIWTEEIAKFYGLSWLITPPTQNAVDSANGNTVTYALAGIAQDVFNQPARQPQMAVGIPTAIPPNTVVPTTVPTDTPLLINTSQPINTPLPSNTPLPTHTPSPATVAAPASTNVATSAIGQVYYVVRSANLRPCPLVNNDCRVTDSLHIGTSVTITGEVQGDVYDGSTLWYSIEYEGQTSYLHSKLVAPVPPTP